MSFLSYIYELNTEEKKKKELFHALNNKLHNRRGKKIYQKEWHIAYLLLKFERPILPVQSVSSELLLSAVSGSKDRHA